MAALKTQVFRVQLPAVAPITSLAPGGKAIGLHPIMTVFDSRKAYQKADTSSTEGCKVALLLVDESVVP